MTNRRAPAFLERGSTAYRRASFALFLVGFSSFSSLYSVQPLLPAFAKDFGVTPAASSLPLSSATALLAISIFVGAIVSEAVGRRGMLFVAVALTAILNLAAALAPSWFWLVALRAMGGLALGGAPAIAMTYVAEEVQPNALGFAMSRYVAGTAFGGMSGRLAGGALAEVFGWRWALATIAAVDLLAACVALVLLPKSRNFVRTHKMTLGDHASAWLNHLRDPALRRLFAIGGLMMGAFVTLYNYIEFRLIEPPFRLGESALGAISIVYVFGVGASSSAGPIAERLGRGKALSLGTLIAAAGIALTASRTFAVSIGGLVIVTMGFFFSHAIASGWIGRLAVGAKGHATSLYLLCYYIGASLAGWSGGYLWSSFGWAGIIAFTETLVGIAFVASLGVRGAARPELTQ